MVSVMGLHRDQCYLISSLMTGMKGSSKFAGDTELNDAADTSEAQDAIQKGPGQA